MEQSRLVEAAKARLQAILEDAEDAGFSREDVLRLATARRPSSRPSPSYLALLFLPLFFIYYKQLYTYKALTAAWIIFNGGDPDHDECAVKMPEFAVDLFRPPVDCSMCRDIRSIDRVTNISPALFEEMYAFSGRPVIVADAMTNWTAPQVFSFDFFRELYADSEAQDRCQFFPYKTEFQGLWEVFQMPEDRAQLKSGDPWYVGWSNCDEEVGQILRQHYQRPYFLPENSENKKTDWIFMGSPGYGAHLHVDNVDNPSWQAQLVGAKNWSLEPPRECSYQCRSHQVTVHSGEIFVLDTNSWYHSTLIVSDGISITIGAEYD